MNNSQSLKNLNIYNIIYKTKKQLYKHFYTDFSKKHQTHAKN